MSPTQPGGANQWHPNPQGWTRPQAPACSWSGTARQRRPGTRREWAKIGIISALLALLVLGASFVSEVLTSFLFVLGYGAMLTWALGLVSRTGPDGTLRLDQDGLWFEGKLLFALQSIRGIGLMPSSQGYTRDGVHVRSFTGGIHVYSTAGYSWFELYVPPELVQLARALGINVTDPPSAGVQS